MGWFTSPTKELEVHMARLPLVTRHELKKNGKQTIEVKAGGKLVVNVPISRRGETKSVTLNLRSAKMWHKSETATMTLKESAPLSAEELCDVLRLHTGKKPPYTEEMEPITIEAGYLLATLKDKQDEIKYKVKLSADITATIEATAPSRWSKAAGVVHVEAVVETKVIFDPIISPEHNPVKTDTLLETAPKDPKESKASKTYKLWPAAALSKKKTAAAPDAKEDDVDASEPPTAVIANGGAEEAEGGEGAGEQEDPIQRTVSAAATSTQGEYNVSESDYGKESVTSQPPRRRSLGTWAAAFRTPKKTATSSASAAALAETPQPLPPQTDTGANEAETEQGEAGAVAAGQAEVVPEPTSAPDGPQPAGDQQQLREPAVSSNPEEYKPQLRIPAAQRQPQKWSEKWSEKLGLKKVNKEEHAEEEAIRDAQAAEFRAQRGHDREEVYMEKKLQADEIEHEEEVDPEVAAAAAAEEEMKKKFGGSSKHQKLYVLCKS